MIIDKVAPYWTEDEKQHIRDLRREQSKLNDLFMEHQDLWDDKFYTDNIDKWGELEREVGAIALTVENRYINAHSVTELIADAKEIISAVEKADFQKYSAARLSRIDSSISDEGKKRSSLYAYMRARVAENYTNCYWYVLEQLYVQLNGIAEEKDKGAERAVITAVEEKIAQWYERPADFDPQNERYIIPADDTPAISFTYPDSHLQGLTRASDRVFSHKVTMDELRQAEIDISPSGSKTGNTYLVTVDMTAPELKGVENLTEYDGSVFNAAISLAGANPHRFFTAKQVATHLLYGDNPAGSQPSPQQIGAVTKSLDKQRHVDITIDWTAHAELNNMLGERDSFKVKGYMLPLKELYANVGGQKIHGYQLIDVAPLHDYATSIGQIATHPVKMLNVPINLDEQKIVMRDFLLRELGHMQRVKHWNKTITVNRILEVAGVSGDDVTRKKKSQLVAAIRRMLDYWKQEQYIIKSYKENKKGNAIYSFTITTL